MVESELLTREQVIQKLGTSCVSILDDLDRVDVACDNPDKPFLLTMVRLDDGPSLAAFHRLLADEGWRLQGYRIYEV